MSIYRLLLGGSVDAPLIAADANIYKSGTLQLVTAVDVVGSELAVDELTADVDYTPGEPWLLAPADCDAVLTADGYLIAAADDSPDLSTLPYGTPAWLTERGEIAAKLYFKDATRIGARTYSIKLMSAVGFLEREKHLGGVYLATANLTVADLLTEIIGDRFSYSVDPAVATHLVRGWLPIGSRRDNLHLLMYAMGFALRKDAAGDISFAFLYDSDGTPVPPSRIFLDRSVDFNAKVTAVEVTEHSFFQLAGTDEEQLFDNANAAAVTDLLVEFDAPCYDLRASGLTITDSGDNYAVVSGAGTLYGKKYAHDTRVIRKAIPGATGTPYVVPSGDDTMINALNSESVAERLAAYYGARRTARMTIKLSGEKAGDMIAFTDALGTATKGLITQAVTRYSTFGKAQLKIIENYTPTGQGNYYTNRALITASGTWTVPPNVYHIRAVIIGAGVGGVGGYDGEQGDGELRDATHPDAHLVEYHSGAIYATGYRYETQYQAQGGRGAAAGSPGNVFAGDYDVTPGEVITVTIGEGGVGGARNGGAGAAGGATTVSSESLGTLTSDDGSVSSGYVDPLTGDVYATAGRHGEDGAAGGTVNDNGDPVDGGDGGDVGEWHGGTGGHGGMWTDEQGLQLREGSGGAGGGAAHGANGHDGTDTYATDNNRFVYLGSGGDGADAVAPAQADIGCGGDGGHGGGGGGSRAAGYHYAALDTGSNRLTLGARGAAGKGSVGGQGGAGAAFFYF